MLDDMPAPLVEIDGLRVEFRGETGPIVAVEDVSFSIAPGETVCVVGESGSGKSVTSLSLMRLVEFGGGRIVGGALRFARPDGRMADLSEADDGTMRHIRGNEIGMIFQEPMTSLNPLHTIGKQINEVLRRYGVEFQLSEDSGRTIIRLIDRENGELIRQIPPEEALNAAQRLEEVKGRLFSLEV